MLDVWLRHTGIQCTYDIPNHTILPNVLVHFLHEQPHSTVGKWWAYLGDHVLKYIFSWMKYLKNLEKCLFSSLKHAHLNFSKSSSFKIEYQGREARKKYFHSLSHPQSTFFFNKYAIEFNDITIANGLWQPEIKEMSTKPTFNLWRKTERCAIWL